MNAECREFALDLSRPLSTAAGTVERREGSLLRVADDSGVAGLGEATPLSGWTESISECRDALARARDALASEGIPEVERGRLPGDDDHPALAAVADAPAARHAVAEAVLDLTARRHRVPLYRTLGAPDWVRRVPVNATVGDGTVTETAQRAVAVAKRGYDCLKVKVGARSVTRDVERLAAVREVLGDGARIRADANGGWTRRQARRVLGDVDDRGIDLEYVEQPLAAGDLAGLAELRREFGTPVAVDETLSTVGLDPVLEKGAADVLVCKPMALGGPDRVVEAHDRVADDLRVVVTTTVDGVVARTGAVHVAASLPDPPACGLATADRLAADLGPDPTSVRRGRITVPQDDGLGRASGWWPEE